MRQAQYAALQVISGLRYENVDAYLKVVPSRWQTTSVSDMTPLMVMHPITPALDGEDLSTFADSKGKLVFVEHVKMCAPTVRVT